MQKKYTVRIYADVDEETAKKIEDLAKKIGVSRTALIRSLIAQNLDTMDQTYDLLTDHSLSKILSVLKSTMKESSKVMKDIKEVNEDDSVPDGQLTIFE